MIRGQDVVVLLKMIVLSPAMWTVRSLADQIAYLVATKLEAFNGRGRGDYVMSHDFEDIVRPIDGREELLGEVAAAPPELRDFLADELGRVLRDPFARDAITAHLPRDVASQERAEAVVVPRIERLVAARR